MQLRNHEKYARALRDQAIADYQVVEYFMKLGRVKKSEADPHMHAVIAKMHQVGEKLLKAYLLFEEKGSFNPFEGHKVVKSWKANRQIGKRLSKLFDLYHGEKREIIEQLELLESLAPSPPSAEKIENDIIVVIGKNTEYPFHEKGKDPTWPARDFNWEDAVIYYKIMKTLMKKLAKSPPYDFTEPIKLLVS